ncbi:MAG: addiction module protein [Balneolaceae bacterium]
MKEIIIKIPDQKVDFVLELIEQLGLEVSSEQMEIPEEHKAIVRERIQKSKANPERLLDWEQVKDSFTLD